MSPDLAALVGSRICHDLISPIGAISNGVELLSLTDGDTTAEMRLISDSVASANARIRFFRIAYGAAAADQHIGRAEVLSILTASALGGRFAYVWQVEDEATRGDVRLAFLAIQCLESALPRGGDISIARDGDIWRLTGAGPRVQADPDHWSHLTGPAGANGIGAAQVHFALLGEALRQSGRKPDVDISDTQITASFASR